MANKRGINKVPAMRGRRTGGQEKPEEPAAAPGTLTALIREWEAHQSIRNYSPKTLESHRWALNTFLDWANERGLQDPAAVTRATLESYQRHLHRHRKKNGQPLGITTQRARLGALQRLFAWLCKNGHIPANPAADLELPRKPHRGLPRGLNQEDIEKLLNEPDTRDPLGIRDRAILETFYATGVRRSELTALDVGDFDTGGGNGSGTLHVRKGKGGRGRTLPVGKNALHWLNKYLEEVREKLLIEAGENALFISGYGARMSPAYIGNWVARTAKKAGVSKPGSCHMLRHSCATHMLEGGADVRLVQQMLGHARLDTTAIYTEVAISHLRSVYEASHPSAVASNVRVEQKTDNP